MGGRPAAQRARVAVCRRGGPILSVVGATLGVMVDRMTSQARESRAVQWEHQDPQWLLVDTLACILAAADSEVSEHLSHMDSRGSSDGQRQVIAELWRCDHPRIAEALDLLARHHPDAVVAREARKAALRARSRLAGV